MVTNTTRLDTPVSFPKDNSEWHHFLDGNVEKALKIREFVENRPETATTFQLNAIDGLDTRHVPDGLVKLTGAWKLPDLFGNNKPQKWVNPHAKNAAHYSDAIVECECGIPVLRMCFGEKEQQPAHHQDHLDCCTKPDRLETRAALLRNRARIVRDAYAHGHSLTSVSSRLGYGHVDYVGSTEAKHWGVDLDAHRKDGRKRVARTAMVLCREYTPETVATLFGWHRRSINSMLKQETVTQPKTLYTIRRKA